MYAWIWRRLPGGTRSKALLAGVLLLAVVALLLFVVFPWVEPAAAVQPGGGQEDCPPRSSIAYAGPRAPRSSSSVIR